MGCRDRDLLCGFFWFGVKGVGNAGLRSAIVKRVMNVIMGSPERCSRMGGVNRGVCGIVKRGSEWQT